MGENENCWILNIISAVKDLTRSIVVMASMLLRTAVAEVYILRNFKLL